MILIQARSTSTRFPNKSMALLDGHPLIRHVYDKCGLAHGKRMMVIPKDDPLKDYFQKEFIPFYEGSEADVLERYYHCAKAHDLDWVIRITGDCPLISPAQIALCLQLALSGKADFMTNCRDEWTDGQEVEFISFRLLGHTHNSCPSGEDREHVTPWIKRNWEELGKAFRLGSYSDPAPAGPKMSVDTPEDLENVRVLLEQAKARRRLYV